MILVAALFASLTLTSARSARYDDDEPDHAEPDDDDVPPRPAQWQQGDSAAGRRARRAAATAAREDGCLEPPPPAVDHRSPQSPGAAGAASRIKAQLKKEKAVLEAAYNDSAGVTAQFNLNLLQRMKHELGADLDVGAFEHHAFYNEADGRIEMHLRCTRDLSFTLGGVEIRFAEGETVHTENSHKYTPGEFAGLAGRAGFERVDIWTDDHSLFSVQLFRIAV